MRYATAFSHESFYSRNFQLEGEDPPTFARMLCFDGNNSLKRLASTQEKRAGDTREYESDYYLSRSEVDQYAHEVKARQHQPKPDLIDPNEVENDVMSSGDASGEGDPTDGAGEILIPCADHWRAAAADNNKKLSGGIFEETG